MTKLNLATIRGAAGPPLHAKRFKGDWTDEGETVRHRPDLNVGILYGTMVGFLGTMFMVEKIRRILVFLRRISEKVTKLRNIEKTLTQSPNPGIFGVTQDQDTGDARCTGILDTALSVRLSK